MSFSIIIPSRNVDNLTVCISAIRATGETCRIIVVWDGNFASHIQAWRVLSDDGNIQSESGAQPFCFSKNCNMGVNAAACSWQGGFPTQVPLPIGDDVFLWNDDALLLPGDRPLTNMVRAVEYSRFQTGRAWGVVSAAVAGHAGPAYPTSPQRLAEIYRGVDRTLWPIRPPNGRMVPFTAVYIPRAVLNDVGPLDERYTGVAEGHEVYGGEDDDWCYRARAKGYSIGVWDGAVVDHATLPSTFRPDGKGRSVDGARARFREIHGFQMGSR